VAELIPGEQAASKRLPDFPRRWWRAGWGHRDEIADQDEDAVENERPEHPDLERRRKRDADERDEQQAADEAGDPSKNPHRGAILLRFSPGSEGKPQLWNSVGQRSHSDAGEDQVDRTGKQHTTSPGEPITWPRRRPDSAGSSRSFVSVSLNICPILALPVGLNKVSAAANAKCPATTVGAYHLAFDASRLVRRAPDLFRVADTALRRHPLELGRIRLRQRRKMSAGNQPCNCGARLQNCTDRSERDRTTSGDNSSAPSRRDW